MFAVDSAGVVTWIGDRDTRGERPTSGEEVRASRRNERHATGPTKGSARGESKKAVT